MAGIWFGRMGIWWLESDIWLVAPFVLRTLPPHSGGNPALSPCSLSPMEQRGMLVADESVALVYTGSLFGWWSPARPPRAYPAHIASLVRAPFAERKGQRVDRGVA